MKSVFFRKKEKAPDWPTIVELLRKSAIDTRITSYYQHFQFHGDELLSRVPFIAVDFETTGLDPEKDDIVSIGLVPFDLKRIFYPQSCHWVVKPRQPLAEDSVVVHGITHSVIQNSPDLIEILGEFLQAISGKIVVVHFNLIERVFLDRALQIRIGEGISFPVVDTMVVEAAILKKRRKNLWKRLRSRKPRPLQLMKCRERYGLPSYDAHHALTDAIATAELFQAQVAHHFPEDTRLVKLWV